MVGPIVPGVEVVAAVDVEAHRVDPNQGPVGEPGTDRTDQRISERNEHV